VTPRSPIFLFINDKHTSGADPEMSSGLDSPFHCCNFSYMTFEIKTILCHKSVKSTKVRVTTWVFSSSKCTKIRFRPGLRPGTRVGLMTLPRPLVDWGRGGCTIWPHSPRRLWRLDLVVFGASLLKSQRLRRPRLILRAYGESLHT